MGGTSLEQSPLPIAGGSALTDSSRSQWLDRTQPAASPRQLAQHGHQSETATRSKAPIVRYGIFDHTYRHLDRQKSGQDSCWYQWSETRGMLAFISLDLQHGMLYYS